MREKLMEDAQREAEDLRRENVQLKENVVLLEHSFKAAVALEKENQELKKDVGELKLRATAAEWSLQATSVPEEKKTIRVT